MPDTKITSTNKGGSPFYERNTKQQYYAKMDWLVNNKNTVTLLWNGNPISIKNRHVLSGWQDSTGYDFPMTMNTLFASWNSTLGANTVLYIKFAGYRDNITKHMYAPDVPMYYDTSNNVYYGGFSEMMRDYSQRTQVNAALTHYSDDFLKSSHEFKVGVEYERSHAGECRQYSGGGDFQSYNYGDGTTLWYAKKWAGRDNLGKVSRFCAFAQDNLQVGKKLFLNLGLRFENPGSRPAITRAPWSSSISFRRGLDSLTILGETQRMSSTPATAGITISP